jgi:hypothetical protein
VRKTLRMGRYNREQPVVEVVNSHDERGWVRAIVGIDYLGTDTRAWGKAGLASYVTYEVERTNLFGERKEEVCSVRTEQNRDLLKPEENAAFEAAMALAQEIAQEYRDEAIAEREQQEAAVTAQRAATAAAKNEAERTALPFVPPETWREGAKKIPLYQEVEGGEVRVIYIYQDGSVLVEFRRPDETRFSGYGELEAATFASMEAMQAVPVEQLFRKE